MFGLPREVCRGLKLVGSAAPAYEGRFCVFYYGGPRRVKRPRQGLKSFKRRPGGLGGRVQTHPGIALPDSMNMARHVGC